MTPETLIKENEGRVMKNGLHVPYRCPAGKLTIGYGTMIENGITEDMAVLLMRHMIDVARADLEMIFDGWNQLPKTWQAVFIDMHYNLGGKRFRGFKAFIAAAKNGDLDGMIREMRNSKWYSQVPVRVERSIQLLTCGS